MPNTYFLFAAAFMMDLCTSLALFAIPLIALALGATVFELGLVGTTGSMAYTLACAFTGKLADRYDRYRLMVIASLCASIIFGLLIFVQQIWQLLVLASLAWIALALFWPALQATLAEGRDRPQLVKTLGTFNLVWTIGFMIGPLIGGALYEIHPRVPFGTAVAGAILLFAGTLLWRPKSHEVQAPEVLEVIEPEHTGDNNRYRLVAWTANFTAFFIMGMLNNQFPKLAEELTISPVILGYLLAVPRLIQFGGFLLMRHTHFWQYKLYPLVIPQCIAIIGMLVVTTSDSPIILALAFTTLGVLIGISFPSSQFYAFFQERQKGERGARNEMIVGLGFVSGPLIGGFLAQTIGLRAPYALCCVVLITGIIIEYWLIKRKN